MVNTNKLKGAYVSYGYTQDDVAKKLNMSKQSFFRKVNNISEFKESEIRKICEILNIENKDDIFFMKDYE